MSELWFVFMFGCFSLGLLIVVTVLMPSWRWVAGFIGIAGSGLLYFGKTYGMITRYHTYTLTGALFAGFMLACLIYLAVQLWVHCRD